MYGNDKRETIDDKPGFMLPVSCASKSEKGPMAQRRPTKIIGLYWTYLFIFQLIENNGCNMVQ
jgi:hypothetical protein